MLVYNVIHGIQMQSTIKRSGSGTRQQPVECGCIWLIPCSLTGDGNGRGDQKRQAFLDTSVAAKEHMAAGELLCVMICQYR
jgi:hypothetical protein